MSACLHIFERFRPWPIKLRYRCCHCGYITRLYDTIDGMGLRPVHHHMTVARKGFNVSKGRGNRPSASPIIRH